MGCLSVVFRAMGCLSVVFRPTCCLSVVFRVWAVCLLCLGL